MKYLKRVIIIVIIIGLVFVLLYIFKNALFKHDLFNESKILCKATLGEWECTEIVCPDEDPDCNSCVCFR